MTREAPLSMPPHLIERARAVIGDSSVEWEIPPVRDAATVVLAADLDSGIHVYLQRRVRTMAFAAGMYVFPGGAVEPTDVAAACEIACPPDRRIDTSGAIPGVDSVPSRIAAVRETAEEAAIVLGDPLGLTYIAHWVTPAVESRRFDTRFYATVVSPSEVRECSTETDDQQWARPIDALRRYMDGDIAMLPPTVAVLSEFARLAEVGYDSVAAIADLGSRPVLPLMPAPYLGAAGELGWQLVNYRTGRTVTKLRGAPAGSETDGVGRE